MKASLASGTIYFAGDVTAQTLIESKSDIDFERTARFALIGACWAGPFCRAGMSRISQFSTKWYYRVALDQSLLMPLNMAVVNWLKPKHQHSKKVRVLLWKKVSKLMRLMNFEV